MIANENTISMKIKKPCFLCGHPLYPKDKSKPISICGMCRMSFPGRKLYKAIRKRMVQILNEKEKQNKNCRDNKQKK